MHNTTIWLDELMPLISERLSAGGSVRFSPHGTSMLPMLKDGRDQVVLSPLPDKLKKYDLPLYRRENGQYVLHRIVKVVPEGLQRPPHLISKRTVSITVTCGCITI